MADKANAIAAGPSLGKVRLQAKALTDGNWPIIAEAMLANPGGAGVRMGMKLVLHAAMAVDASLQRDLADLRKRMDALEQQRGQEKARIRVKADGRKVT